MVKSAAFLFIGITSTRTRQNRRKFTRSLQQVFNHRYNHPLLTVRTRNTPDPATTHFRLAKPNAQASVAERNALFSNTLRNHNHFISTRPRMLATITSERISVLDEQAEKPPLQMKTIKTITRIAILLIAIICAAWPIFARAALPAVSGATTTIYASVSDPMNIDIGDDGVMFVGRDNVGSGGTTAEAVKIHRIGVGGTPVEEFGNSAIPDPDAVIIDRSGTISGTQGAVLVGGQLAVLHSFNGRLSKISPDGMVTAIFDQSATIGNPDSFVFDQSGRLLMTTNRTGQEDGRVAVISNGIPTVLITQRGASWVAVDSQNRIVLSNSYEANLRLYDSGGSMISADFAPAKFDAPVVLAKGGFWGADIYTISASEELVRVDLNGNTTVVGTGFGNVHHMTFGPDGALYLSEFTADRILRVVPDPLPVLTIRVSQIELCWNTVPGKTYQVQYHQSLDTTGTWTNLGVSVLGDGANHCMTDAVPVDQPRRFYRVVVTSP